MTTITGFREKTIVPNTPCVLLDRIELDGVVANIAAITNIKTRIFQYPNREDAVADNADTRSEVGTVITTLSAACMFDTLQLDGMWNNKDTIGYNAKVTVSGARFLNGGKWYRAEQVVQPSAGGAEPVGLVPWILSALTSAID